MSLASFDIFDTALIRKCGSPEVVFYLLAHRLYPDDESKREDFLRWRRHIEVSVVLPPEKSEASLTDFYRDCKEFGFGEYSSDEFREMEERVESENLIANPAVRDLIAQKRAEGYQIIFISDMYLGSHLLSKVLQREGCLEPGEKVYVSCECQARKDTGTLYEMVRAQLKPQKWVHYGDNRRSDIKMARRHGIKARWIDVGFTAVEQRMAAAARNHRDHYPLTMLAGLSRAARVAAGNTPEAILAADFVAPAYIPYLIFIFRIARQRGVMRLYFLSRDGYILRRAAQASAPTDLEIRDLFVSRRSLILPYLADDFSEEAYLAVVDRHTLLQRKVSQMLWQLGLTRQELQDKYGIQFACEQIFSPGQERDFLDKLFKSSFTPALKELAVAARTRVLAYFKQEGLMDETPVALVDIGWLGSSRLMINSLLKHAGCRETAFFYYGIRRDVFPCRFGRYDSFFREGVLSTESTVLIENYFSQSRYPSTRGYRLEAGKVLPVWEEGKEIRDTPLLRTHETIMEWLTREMRTRTWREEDLYAWAEIAVTTIGRLEDKLDLSPLERVGDFDSTVFVRKLSIGEVIRILLGGRVTAFDQASLQLTVGHSLMRYSWKTHKYMAKSLYKVYRALPGKH